MRILQQWCIHHLVSTNPSLLKGRVMEICSSISMLLYGELETGRSFSSRLTRDLEKIIANLANYPLQAFDAEITVLKILDIAVVIRIVAADKRLCGQSAVYDGLAHGLELQPQKSNSSALYL